MFASLTSLGNVSKYIADALSGRHFQFSIFFLFFYFFRKGIFQHTLSITKRNAGKYTCNIERVASKMVRRCFDSSCLLGYFVF